MKNRAIEIRVMRGRAMRGLPVLVLSTYLLICRDPLDKIEECGTGTPLRDHETCGILGKFWS